jgi:predicted small lipoprotein YifL
MPATTLKRALLAALLVTLAACGGKPAMRDPSQEAHVRVENQAWVEMVVYVQREGRQRTRLGEVGAQETRVFRLPSSMVGGTVSVRFIADPVGGSQNPYSSELSVQPGQTIRLTIPNRNY